MIFRKKSGKSAKLFSWLNKYNSENLELSG